MAAVLLLPALAAGAADIAGTWLDGPRDAAISLAACADSLCGTIVWLRDPLGPDGLPDIDRHNSDPARRTRPLCGMSLVGGFHRDGSAASWRGGWIYDPDTGDTYHATLELKQDGTLAVRGYVGIPLFGRTEIWTRAEPPPMRCSGARQAHKNS